MFSAYFSLTSDLVGLVEVPFCSCGYLESYGVSSRFLTFPYASCVSETVADTE